MEPTRDNVIIEIITRADQFAKEVKNRSGLIVTTAKTQEGEPETGIVHAIGPDAKDASYHIGDFVRFEKGRVFRGFKHDEKDFVVVRHDEILLVFKEGK